MPERLTGDDRVVEIEGVRITSPGLTGTVEVHRPGSPGMRAAEAATADLHSALAATGMVEQLTVEILRPEERPLPAGAATRSTARDEPALVVEVPGPGSGRAQVLLAADEDGVLSWHLPVDGTPAQAATRGEERRTYLLPRRVVPAAAAGTRGLIGAVGRKLFKVLSFRLLDPVLGRIGDGFASAWERRNRPHRLRSFSRDDFQAPAGTELAPTDFARLAGGRALLFVHGTLSTTHGAFGRIEPALVDELHQRYGGRVFAFDHPTISVTPQENARVLAQLLAEGRPAGQGFDVDVVAHSRGGLVIRELVERPGEAGLPEGLLRLGTVVFVATPNAGTALADRHHLSDFVDTFTNLLELVPDNPVVEILASVITVLKQVAVGALGGLDGITAQAPGSEYLTGLNRGAGAPPAP
ncbi:MAG TPA: hypothetical protein VHQ65_04790, partial [Thermoanaerobaculia bacterium]|nr:hypothetical protein [Thermoanaerobaculia bacterium]